jgi:hypothetical protein
MICPYCHNYLTPYYQSKQCSIKNDDGKVNHVFFIDENNDFYLIVYDLLAIKFRNNNPHPNPNYIIFNIGKIKDVYYMQIKGIDNIYLQPFEACNILESMNRYLKLWALT